MRLAPRTAAAFILVLALAACSSGGPPSAPPGASAPASATASSSSASAASTEDSQMSAMPSSSSTTAKPSTTATGPFSLTSSAFGAGDAIPREFTCDGANVSPPLDWTGVPAGTAALVLFVDDPDAGAFVHWIVLDLPGTDGHLTRGVIGSAATPHQGRNDFGDSGWGGPCPPSGTHRYRFTLTALSAPLGLAGHPDGSAVRAALSGAKANELGKATLTATYRRG